MRQMVLGTSILGASLVCAGLVAQQTQPTPGPGSGIVTVTGTVNVGNMPPLILANVPDVRVSALPAVALAPLGLVKTGGRYEVVWSSTEIEVVTISEIGPGGWVAVQGKTPRWVNLGLARSIEPK